MQSERNKRIDMLKGLGIIFVVMGHVGTILDQYVYTFHMGLFFFISGYLYKSTDTQFIEYVERKIKSLIIPYVVFWAISFLWAECANLFAGYSLIPLDIPHLKGLVLGGHYLADTSYNFPLWYFQLSFIASICFYWIMKCSKRWRIAIAILCLAVTFPIQEYFMVTDNLRPVFHINVLSPALFFMLLGSFVKDWTEKGAKPKLWLGLLCLLLGGLITLKYHCNIAYIGNIFCWISAILSILGWFVVCNAIAEKDCLLSKIGFFSLYIYGLHNLVKRPVNMLLGKVAFTGQLGSALTVFFTLAICLLIAFIYSGIVKRCKGQPQQ